MQVLHTDAGTYAPNLAPLKSLPTPGEWLAQLYPGTDDDDGDDTSPAVIFPDQEWG